MLPHIHLITSGAAVFIFASAVGLPGSDILSWLIVGVLATLAIDLDHFAVQMLYPDRRPVIVRIFTHPLEYLEVKKLERTLHFEGFGIIRLKAHLVEVLAAVALIWHFQPPYSIAILVSLWTHILMDVVQTVTEPDRR